MSRYRIDLAYDGGGFHGYARQNGLRTVQGELESALADVLGITVETAVAGRTDAGVHAWGQVASFELEDDIDGHRLTRSLNGILGPEIAVRGIEEAGADFHARFSALSRTYRYLVDTTDAPDPLQRHHVWQVRRALDVAAMKSAVAPLRGEHDFSSFCRRVDDKTNVRKVADIRWEGSGGAVTFWITANAFCQQMVRSIVGYSYDVGRGYARAEGAADVLAAGDRSAVATVAPPHGLTLWEVGY